MYRSIALVTRDVPILIAANIARPTGPPKAAHAVPSNALAPTFMPAFTPTRATALAAVALAACLIIDCVANLDAALEAYFDAVPFAADKPF